MRTLSEKLTLSGSKISSFSVNHGKWRIETSQVVDKDWDFYSKSWHKAHGPKITISDRKVTFTKPHGKGFIKKEVELESWAGDFIARAVIDEGLAPKSDCPLNIRLSMAYDAVLVKSFHGYKIYSRKILGEHQDWVIVSPLGITYHDADRKNLISGLHKKIRNSTKNIFGDIDFKKVRKLGFCKEGILAFCHDFELDIKGIYSADQIYRKVKENFGKAGKYLAELKILANAMNYKVPEFK